MMKYSIQKKNWLKYTLISLVIIITLIEFVLRFYGLYNYPLYESNELYEYILKPNQNVKIYRNSVSTNAYSMRSVQINKSDSIVVLLIGDSILNGGNEVDQSELASTILENRLRSEIKKNIRVLNISCKTWGPENLYRYLSKFGIFNADLIIFVSNGGDAFDHITFKDAIGTEFGRPNKNYPFAIMALFEKAYYNIISKFRNQPLIISNSSTKKDSLDIGFYHLESLTKKTKVPFLVYLHGDVSEMNRKEYSEDSKLILDFFNNRNVSVIKEINFGNKKEYYLDGMHFNAKGQKYMSDILYPRIFPFFK